MISWNLVVVQIFIGILAVCSFFGMLLEDVKENKLLLFWLLCLDISFLIASAVPNLFYKVP